MNNNKEFNVKIFLDNSQENLKIINELKQEIIDIKNQNKKIKETIEAIQNNFNGHNIFLEKFLKNKEKIKITKKTKNLKELFQKYLYHLKIYSPYCSILNNENINDKKKEKEDFIIKDNICYNNIRDIFINDNLNTESFFDNNSFLKMKQNIDSCEISNLINNNSSIPLQHFQF